MCKSMCHKHSKNLKRKTGVLWIYRWNLAQYGILLVCQKDIDLIFTSTIVFVNFLVVSCCFLLFLSLLFWGNLKEHKNQCVPQILRMHCRGNIFVECKKKSSCDLCFTPHPVQEANKIIQKQLHTQHIHACSICHLNI